MKKYVALLRGIAPMNSNMNNVKLRNVIEELGFLNVRSVVASGNILFESPREDVDNIEAQIEQEWPRRLGFSSTTIIRSIDELMELHNKRPFRTLTHSKQTSLNVTFLKRTPSKAMVIASGESYSVVATYEREVCSVLNTDTGKTPLLMAKLEQEYGKEITTRTWLTVERIIKKSQE